MLGIAGQPQLKTRQPFASCTWAMHWKLPTPVKSQQPSSSFNREPLELRVRGFTFGFWRQWLLFRRSCRKDGATQKHEKFFLKRRTGRNIASEYLKQMWILKRAWDKKILSQRPEAKEAFRRQASAGAPLRMSTRGRSGVRHSLPWMCGLGTGSICRMC